MMVRLNRTLTGAEEGSTHQPTLEVKMSPKPLPPSRGDRARFPVLLLIVIGFTVLMGNNCPKDDDGDDIFGECHQSTSYRDVPEVDGLSNGAIMLGEVVGGLPNFCAGQDTGAVEVIGEVQNQNGVITICMFMGWTITEASAGTDLIMDCVGDLPYDETVRIHVSNFDGEEYWFDIVVNDEGFDITGHGHAVETD